MNRQYLYQQIRLGGILVLPALLFCVPVDWLSEQHTVCLFKNIFGVECWGCGITRAIISAVQFDFEAAFHYNKLIIVVMPLMIYLWTKEIFKFIQIIKNHKAI